MTTKENSKPDKDYDFKAVKKIVVGPITSNDVDLGKVDEARKPKVAAILKKSKESLKKNMIEGAKAAKTTIPFAGKAKAKGGMVIGGLDSEVLWTATNMANADIYKYLEKKTGLDWSFWSGVTKGAKTGVKNSVDVIKEEKGEKDAWKKKGK